MAVTEIEIFLPFEAAQRTPGQTRFPPPTIPHDPTVAFLDNTKPKAGHLLEAIGRALTEKQAIAEFFIQRKRFGHAPIDEDVCDQLADAAQVIVTGVGDCGGCTAGTVTDAVRCAERGAMAFVVVTDRFVSLAESVSHEYGLAQPEILVIDHPIWTRSKEWFNASAGTLAEQILVHLDRASAERVG